MSLKRIVINTSCVMFAALAGLSILIMNGQASMYKKLHKDYMTLSNEYDKLAEESKDKTIAIETLQNTIAELKSEQPKWTAIGTFKITAYGVDCSGCTGLTKSGTVPQEGRTIAVDPSVIPLGSEVMFDGEIYVAEDIGGAIQGNVIDLFYGTESESLEYGIQYHTVYIKGGE